MTGDNPALIFLSLSTLSDGLAWKSRTFSRTCFPSGSRSALLLGLWQRRDSNHPYRRTAGAKRPLESLLLRSQRFSVPLVASSSLSAHRLDNRYTCKALKELGRHALGADRFSSAA